MTNILSHMRYPKFKKRRTTPPKELGDAQEFNEQQLVKMIVKKIEANKPVIVKKVKIEYIDTNPLLA